MYIAWKSKLLREILELEDKKDKPVFPDICIFVVPGQAQGLIFSFF